MKNNTKKVLRITSITEYKTLEGYLEKMAAKGFMLSEIKRATFVFTKTEPRELNFNVSLFYHTTPFDYPDHEKDKDYRELCEASGWIYCTSNEVYQIYYVENNKDAIPIHTDSQEEYRIIKNTFLKTEFISMILLLFILGTQFFNFLIFNYESLLSNIGLFTVISPIFMIFIMLSIYAYPITWLIKNKINLSKGKKLTFSTNKGSSIRNIITWTVLCAYLLLLIFAISGFLTNSFKGLILLVAFLPTILSALLGFYLVKRFKTVKRTRTQNILFFSVTLVLTMIISIGGVFGIISSCSGFEENHYEPNNIIALELSDFGTNATPERNTTRKDSSILAPVSFYYYESLGRKPKNNEIMTVRTEYISCINKTVADYIFDKYMKEERERLQERILEALEFGDDDDVKYYENQITEVSNDLWNVDRGYYLWNSKSNIIIQKNNVIYILDSDVDFSEKEIVAICEKKFGL